MTHEQSIWPILLFSSAAPTLTQDTNRRLLSSPITINKVHHKEVTTNKVHHHHKDTINNNSQCMSNNNHKEEVVDAVHHSVDAALR